MKILEIKDIVSLHKKKGVSAIWVFENLIQPRFIISYATFNNYLAVSSVDIRNELDELDRKEKEKSKQLSLMFN